jgi:hypothetical protein
MVSDDRACDRYGLRIRHFLHSVAHAVHANAEGAWRLTPPAPIGRARLEALPAPRPRWSDFVATSIYLGPASDPYAHPIADVDGGGETCYTGLKIVDEQRQFGGTRVQKVAVRSYFALPALACEVYERTNYLKESARCRPLRCRHWVYGVPDTLTTRERRRMQFVPPEECVALTAVAVAEDEPVVMFSPNADWPNHTLVDEVAARLRVRIVRRNLSEIPPPILRHVRCVQYRVPSASELERRREE